MWLYSYNKMAKKILLEAIKSLGISKEELTNKVQEVYRGYFEEKETVFGKLSLYEMVSLSEFTNIKPEIPENLIQEYYIRNTEKYLSGRWQELIDASNFTGVKPSKDTVQALYTGLLQNRHYVNIIHIIPFFEDLRKISGLALTEAIPKTAIQEKFKTYFRRGEITELEKLSEYTGIKPKISEDEVQDEYNNYVRGGNPYCLYDLERLREYTKIEPKLSKDAIEEGYKGLVGQGRIDQLAKLIKFTGIGPSEEIIQAGYRTYLSGYSEMTGTGIDLGIKHTKELLELTQIKPSEDTVQSAYNYIFNEKLLGLIKDLEKITGVKPKILDEIQELYKTYAKNGKFYSMQHGINSTEIKPSGEVYNIFIESLFKR